MIFWGSKTFYESLNLKNIFFNLSHIEKEIRKFIFYDKLMKKKVIKKYVPLREKFYNFICFTLLN